MRLNDASPGDLPPGLQQRVVGAGEGQPVDGHEAERGPGHVDALEEPGGGEQAARLLAGEGRQQLGLGQVALGEDGVGQLRPEGVGRGLHGPPAGEQRQRAPAGRGDERLQLVVALPGEGRVAGVGQVGRAVEERPARRSRTGCRRRARRCGRRAGRAARAGGGGMVALVSTAVRLSHSGSEHPVDLDRRHLEAGRRGRCRRPRPRSPARTARLGVEVSASVVAAFWARTLRWFASPTPVSMARRPACTSSTRPRPSTSASATATGSGSRQALAQRGAGAPRRAPRRLCSSRRWPVGR